LAKFSTVAESIDASSAVTNEEISVKTTPAASAISVRITLLLSTPAAEEE
jgi:hypothetical protein